MVSPCYNPETKIDCPNREAGCAATCPKWAEYLTERDKIYAERRRKILAKNGHYEKILERAVEKERYRKRRGKLY